MTPTDVLPTTLTVAQAAKILGIHERTAYRAVRNGSIPSYRVSERRIVVPTRALLAKLAGEDGVRAA